VTDDYWSSPQKASPSYRDDMVKLDVRVDFCLW